MEPLKRCVLLALALQVAVVAEEGCRELRFGADGAERTRRIVLECAGETKKDLSNSSSSCGINDTACENSSWSVEDNQGFNISRMQPEKPLLLNSHRSDNKSDGGTWLSTVEVNLLGNISDLDLSNFSSAKTVILNTKGFLISKVRGAKNILNLIVTTSSDKNLNVVTFFGNVNFLNLSWNEIETFPVTELPPLISSIDLSFNNISLAGNYSLPLSLRTLNVSYNNVSNTGFILKGNVIVLNFRGNELTRVPVLEMKSLEELYLSSNFITTLRERAFFGLKNLTILDLRANRLNNIEEKVFQGLNRLQLLDLSENNLVTLAPATFQYLSNLVTLLLSNNVNLGNLQDFEDASLLFGTGQRLQEIEASGTNLSRIPSTVTRSVRRLLLTDNSICTIQCGEVDSFPLLQVIDVSNNMISEIEEDALGRLEFLSDLILAGNKLVNIPKSLPNQLQVLDLRCNTIVRLTNIDFLGLQKLRVLLLSMNNISVVEDGTFGQLINLDVLDLSHNPIKTLYRSSFTGPRRLKELYLISLTDLFSLKEPLSFPAPESSHLEVLNLDFSPELAIRLMDDVAALTMFHELLSLSLRGCELKSLRSDLPSYLPRLHTLDITNNNLNCSDLRGIVKWLNSLSSSNQSLGKSRLEFYNTHYKSCKNVPKNDEWYDENVTCADSEIFSDISTKSLTTEDIVILRTEQVTQATTEQLTSASSTETLPEIATETVFLNITTENLLFFDTSSSSTEPRRVSTSSTATSGQHVTPGHQQVTTKSTETTAEYSIELLNNTNPKQSKVQSKHTLNKLQNTWKYSKSKTKTQSTVEPLIKLLNGSKHIMVIDNQLNDSISSGAFLAHDAPPSSHPGMMVFLLLVGVILVASSAMVYSHWAQRRSSQYHHQQDIEVSSFGGHELW